MSHFVIYDDNGDCKRITCVIVSFDDDNRDCKMITCVIVSFDDDNGDC